jgi:chemotaxis protein CheZ
MIDTQSFNNFQSNLQRDIMSMLGARTQLTPADVEEIVKQVLSSLQGFASPGDLKFYTELEELARFIRQAKQEIASIKPKDISNSFIPSATDELDAVVGSTEEATNKIMDVCDKITEIAGKCPAEVNEALIGCTTNIYEACNFQDITGQRITKVVETLKHIDARVTAIVKAMGDEIHRGDGDGRVPRHVHAADPDNALLNGPQLPKEAISQDDIDKLMGN